MENNNQNAVNQSEKALKNAYRMGQEKISKLVFSFTGTTLIALIINSVYNFTDALFVSWGVGDFAMGGVSVVFPFVILQSAIATAVGGGAASLVSRLLGAGKNKEAGEIVANAMFVFYVTAVLVTILGFAFMNPFLKAMGVTDDIFHYAKQYFMIILAGNVFSTGFSSIIRAEGKMVYGLLIWVIPITINIVLDAIFILVLKWGVSGSAAATVICQFISFIMSVIFFAKFSLLNFKGAKIGSKRIGEILLIGLPSLVQMGSLSIMSIFLNNILKNVSGTLGITAFAYISKIVTYAIVPFTAVSQALAPIVGFNYGAGNLDRVRKTFGFCTLITSIYAVIALIIAISIPNYLAMIFTADKTIIDFAANGIRIIALSLPLYPLPMLVGATLQAEGKRFWALFLYASNLIFIILPTLIMSKYLGVNGIWWSWIIANLCATVLAAIKLLIEKQKAEKMNLLNEKYVREI